MKRRNKEKKIKQLDIVFENCEVFTLTPDMISMCSICGIKDNIGVNCFQYEAGEVYDSISCEELLLVINEKGLEQKSSFEFETYHCPELKERLKFNDITHIDIIYEDDSNSYIMVPWQDKDGNEYCNALQCNVFDKDYTDSNIVAVIIDQQKLTKAKRFEKYGF